MTDLFGNDTAKIAAESEAMKAALKYIKKMADHELGCAPSAGYMMELIKEAREVLERFGSRK